MNTQQVEQMTGISRQNIRYYEKEGLLSPKRDEGNGYRIYSREDVEILKRVKMLRMLGMQLDVIRSVLHGEESLEEAVVRQREAVRTSKAAESGGGHVRENQADGREGP